ncbi:hypothetical protein DFR65_10860 [Oceanihabitans sediminis]|uniref:Uncharacterized protein n=1 Tax=Oceanihabitans sediminis TaxID=1812012 RepID=A0A368P2Q4_9FLAO|nr:hypothetical protein [Oceanihabitans sediminis]MDX1774477.1 hypothetical protein [Oceanihabitans sediminis]RBP27763.1 hypothetical protein DFR65_10860 [Oceanihabitans sediminis]RCU56550.1 hypothetical protein DU428_11675 [Oceanihabitans sediminis]
MEQQLVNLLMYIIPALITGAIAFLFFKEHIENENNRRNFMIHKELQKEAFPLRLQAYERLTLFLERISPSKLLLRVNPISTNKEDYEALLIASIEQEFEHNLAQQIYVTEECWNIVNASKNATIQIIRKATKQDKVDSASKLREVILNDMIEGHPPSHAGLSYIKNEVSKMFQ